MVHVRDFKAWKLGGCVPGILLVSLLNICPWSSSLCSFCPRILGWMWRRWEVGHLWRLTRLVSFMRRSVAFHSGKGYGTCIVSFVRRAVAFHSWKGYGSWTLRYAIWWRSCPMILAPLEVWNRWGHMDWNASPGSLLPSGSSKSYGSWTLTGAHS